jgi:hypothetical protein
MICGKCEALNALIDGYRRERDEARALNAEWAQKAATWIASPEAAQRLDGYRDLGQQVAEAQRERDEARAEMERLREAMRLAWTSCGCCKCVVCNLAKDALHPKKAKK